MLKSSLKALALGGLFVGLAVLLEYLTLFIPSLPQGGKIISLGMIPLIVYALLQGWKWGVPAGLIFGVINALIIDRFVIHPLQFFLDYIFAFGLVGIAGIFTARDNSDQIVAAIIVANVLRFLSHFFSGVIFIDMLKPGIANPWLYSLIYNGVYMLPTTIACCILVPPIIRKLRILTDRS